MLALRARFQAWLQARLTPQAVWQLNQRRVYIVPTRAGLAFGLMLSLLLVASINFQLNLGYALTFLLAGSAVVSLHMTHENLRGLSLHVRLPQPAHMGEEVWMEVVITNPGQARWGLGFSLHGAPPSSWTDAPAQSQSTVTLSTQAKRRGHHALPALQVETRFPFGLFRAWSVWRPAGQAWVYPAKEWPAPALPAPSAQAQSLGSQRIKGQDELSDLRPWQHGDSLRQVVWRKWAQTGQLISREPSANGDAIWLLSWQHLPQMGVEARLSRLTTWVMQAEQAGVPWRLELPGLPVETTMGAQRARQALEALATFEGRS